MPLDARAGSGQAGRPARPAPSSSPGAEPRTSTSRPTTSRRVTEVDRRCEALIRGRAARLLPGRRLPGRGIGHGRRDERRRTWIVDPLDGTRPYIRGIVTHAVLIALEDAAGLALGVIHLPAMDLTCWAARGGGAFCNGEPARVSATATVADAIGQRAGLPAAIRRAARSPRLRVAAPAPATATGSWTPTRTSALATGRIDFCVNLLDAPVGLRRRRRRSSPRRAAAGRTPPASRPCTAALSWPVTASSTGRCSTPSGRHRQIDGRPAMPLGYGP